MSEQPKHTPGPWIADVRSENCAFIEGPPTSYGECYFENAADARLIAAAPELLAALKRAREAVNAIVLSTHSVSFTADLKAIEAAISKAETQS